MTSKDSEKLKSELPVLEPEERKRRLREIQLPLSRKIIKHPDFEIAWPDKVSVIGFLVVLAVCALIVFGTWFLGQLIIS